MGELEAGRNGSLNPNLGNEGPKATGRRESGLSDFARDRYNWNHKRRISLCVPFVPLSKGEPFVCSPFVLGRSRSPRL